MPPQTRSFTAQSASPADVVKIPGEFAAPEAKSVVTQHGTSIIDLGRHTPPDLTLTPSPTPPPADPDINNNLKLVGPARARQLLRFLDSPTTAQDEPRRAALEKALREVLEPLPAPSTPAAMSLSAPPTAPHPPAWRVRLRRLADVTPEPCDEQAWPAFFATKTPQALKTYVRKNVARWIGLLPPLPLGAVAPDVLASSAATGVGVGAMARTTEPIGVDAGGTAVTAHGPDAKPQMQRQQQQQQLGERRGEGVAHGGEGIGQETTQQLAGIAAAAAVGGELPSAVQNGGGGGGTGDVRSLREASDFPIAAVLDQLSLRHPESRQPVHALEIHEPRCQQQVQPGHEQVQSQSQSRRAQSRDGDDEKEREVVVAEVSDVGASSLPHSVPSGEAAAGLKQDLTASERRKYIRWVERRRAQWAADQENASS